MNLNFLKRHIARVIVLIFSIIVSFHAVRSSVKTHHFGQKGNGMLGIQSSMLHTRGDWGKELKVPDFCQKLIENPVPFKKECKRNGHSMICDNLNGLMMMFSQYHQDYYLYTRHFVHKKTPGVYLDVATNEAVSISNTYFYDRCLGWQGICVEANPEYFERIYRYRSCHLVPTCVGSRDGDTVDFLMNGGGGGVLGDTYKSMKKIGNDTESIKARTYKARCTTINLALERERVKIIDYMSLDVEGHELEVLRGINWERVQINIMTIEVSGKTLPDIEELLKSVGYKRHMPDLDDRAKEMGVLGEDAIYLHPSVKFGEPR